MAGLQRPVRQEIVALALPAVLGTMLQHAVSVVDIFLVGGLGAPAIAAVGIGQLLCSIPLTMVWGLSSGVTVVVAHLYGARRQAEASRLAFHAVLLGLAVSLVVSLTGWFLGQEGARWLGAEPAVIGLADRYTRIVFAVFGFTALVNILSNVFYGVGDARTPLYAAILINILHVLIAYPLIYGVWGAPALGVVGAAIAIGVSEGCGAALLLWVMARRGMIRSGWDNRGDMVLLREMIRIGLPACAERALQQTGQAVYLRLIMLYGTTAYAAHQVGLAIEALSFTPGSGISTAVTTTVGQSLGANQPERAALANREAHRIAVIVMAGMGVVFFFFPYLLLRLFTTDAEVIRLGTLFLKIVAVLQIPLAIAMVLAGSLKGAGDTRYLLVTTTVGCWFVRVPIAVLFAVVLHLSLPFVWGVMVMDWTVRMVMLLLRYRSQRWQQAIVTSGLPTRQPVQE